MHIVGVGLRTALAGLGLAAGLGLPCGPAAAAGQGAGDGGPSRVSLALLGGIRGYQGSGVPFGVFFRL